jgi:hypothetical protein
MNDHHNELVLLTQSHGHRFVVSAPEPDDEWVGTRGIRRLKVIVKVIRATDDTVIYSTYYHYPDIGTLEMGDILGALVSDAQAGSMTFEEFCSEYDYDSDSRKAFGIHGECQKALVAMRALFGPHFDKACELAVEL